MELILNYQNGDEKIITLEANSDNKSIYYEAFGKFKDGFIFHNDELLSENLNNLNEMSYGDSLKVYELCGDDRCETFYYKNKVEEKSDRFGCHLVQQKLKRRQRFTHYHHPLCSQTIKLVPIKYEYEWLSEYFIQPKDLCLKVVRKHPRLIGYVDDQTDDLLEAAVSKSRASIRYMDAPSFTLLKKWALTYKDLYKNIYFLEYIPQEIKELAKNATYDPNLTINSEEEALKLVGKYWKYVKNIPKHLMTEKIMNKALEGSPVAIKYLPNPTIDMEIYAIFKRTELIFTHNFSEEVEKRLVETRPSYYPGLSPKMRKYGKVIYNMRKNISLTEEDMEMAYSLGTPQIRKELMVKRIK